MNDKDKFLIDLNLAHARKENLLREISKITKAMIANVINKAECIEDFKLGLLVKEAEKLIDKIDKEVLVKLTTQRSEK